VTIEVYAFEDRNGESVSDFTTQDIAEARKFAAGLRCVLVARQYEYTDSEVVEDYSEEPVKCLLCGESFPPDELDEDQFCPACVAEIDEAIDRAREQE